MKVSDTIDETTTTNTTLPVEVPQPGLAPARIGSISLLFNKVGFTKRKRKESIASNYIESAV